MDNLHLLQAIFLIVGAFTTYRGLQGLLQSDEEFIRSSERRARPNAKIDGIIEKEAMRRYVDFKRDNPGSWRLMAVMLLAAGIIMLLAFVVTLIL
jgi:hypothetical protein